MSMDRLRAGVPATGRIVADPPYAQWAAVLEANRQASSLWTFAIAGQGFAEFRRSARAECRRLAEGFSAVMEIPLAEKDPEAPVIMTGHQPELYHPGVWVKDFLLQRFTEQHPAIGIDVVVDTDGFDTVGVTVPCIAPRVQKRDFPLATGTEGGCFGCTEAPDAEQLSEFFEAAGQAVRELPQQSLATNLDVFRSCMESVVEFSGSLADLVTYARRRFEARAGNDYLELPVTALARSGAWRSFVAELAFDARRFATAYNEALAEFRSLTGTRNPAQPFPDLEIGEESVELPLWLFSEGRRTPVFVTEGARGLVLTTHGQPVMRLGDSVETAIAQLSGTDLLVAPKALTLTTFNRLFLSDLFIHGTGGGRYDAVTDGVISRYFGIEPPAFIVASASLTLPLGAQEVGEDELARAKDRVNRLQHNPDALLGEIELDEPVSQARARELAAEKTALVAEIAAPGADKKVIGRRIREVNEELAALLEPLRTSLAGEVARLEELREEWEVLSDRSYPFCLWDPVEFARMVGSFADGDAGAL